MCKQLRQLLDDMQRRKYSRPYLAVELEHLLVGQSEEVGALELQDDGPDGVVDVKARPGGLAVQVVAGAPVQLHDGPLDAELKHLLLVGEGGLAAARVDGRFLTVLVLHPLVRIE